MDGQVKSIEHLEDTELLALMVADSYSLHERDALSEEFSASACDDDTAHRLYALYGVAFRRLADGGHSLHPDLDLIAKAAAESENPLNSGRVVARAIVARIQLVQEQTGHAAPANDCSHFRL